MSFPGWAIATIGDVLTGVEAGKSEQTLERRPNTDDVGVVKVSAVTWGEFDANEAKAIPLARFDPAKAIRKGDLLFSRANTVNLVGAVVHVGSDHPRLMLSDKILRLRLAAEVSPRFVMFALRTAAARAHLEASATGTSTSMRNVTQESLRTTPLPLPPANEQRRIVAKLDAVFGQTRAAKARLERLPALIEKLKRSILAAAFRGDLTADWRAANPDVEPASKLLTVIEEHRRACWVDGLVARGKDPQEATFEPPQGIHPGELPSLPPTWAWSTLDAVRAYDEPLCYGVVQPGDAPESNGVFLIRVCDLSQGTVSLDDLRTISPDVDAEYARSRVAGGEVLVSVVGTIGRVAIVPRLSRRANIARAVAKLVPVPQVSPSWVRWWLSSTFMENRLAFGAREVARATLNIEVLRDQPIPMAPIAEMHALVERLDATFAALDANAKRAAQALERFQRLEQSLLATAFRGELVPQDPADEPAAVLLERIRAAKAEALAATRRGRGPAAAPYVVPPAITLAQAAESGPLFKHALDRRQRAATDAPDLDLVIAALQQSDGRLTAAAIAQATGLDAAAIRQALKDLIASGQVRTHGKARGTTYEWLQ